MPKYTFEVMLKAHAKEFSAAFKQALGEVGGLEKRIKTMAGVSSEEMKLIGRNVSGIFSIEKLRLAIDFFQAISRGVQTVIAGVKEFGQSIIDANSEWETQQVSLATTLNLMNDMVDSKGQLLNSQEAFNYSLELARDIQNELSLMAIKYLGETKDYVGAYSTLYTLVAGTTKAADVDKIKDRTLALSQVAVVLSKIKPEIFTGGVDQIKRELGFLLRGKIESRNPLITALGISPETAKEWFKAGTLIENLIKQTEVFRTANDASAGTWQGLLATLSDLWSRFERVIGADAFKAAETALKKFVDYMVIGEGAALRLNPVFQQFADIFANIFQNTGSAAQQFIDKLVEYSSTHGPTLLQLGKLFDAILTVILQNMMDLLDYIAAHDAQIQGWLASLETTVYTLGRIGESFAPIFQWLERFLGILNEIAKTVAVISASALGTLIATAQDFGEGLAGGGRLTPAEREKMEKNEARKNMGRDFARTTAGIWGGFTGDKMAGVEAQSRAAALERAQRQGAVVKSIFDSQAEVARDRSKYKATPKAGSFIEDLEDKMNRMTVEEAARKFRAFEKQMGAFPEITGETFRTKTSGKQEVTFNLVIGSEKETITADMNPEEFAKFKKAAEALEAERIKKNRLMNHKEFTTPQAFRKY